MNKPKTTTLNDLSLLGEVLLPSYAKGGAVEKTINGVKENQELRAKLTPKPRFNIGLEYLSSLDKQSPDEPKIRYVDPLTDKEKEQMYGITSEHLTSQQIFDKYGINVNGQNDDPNTIYLDPMTEEQRELQYGARIEPLPTTKRVSLLAKQNNRRY